VVRVFDVMAEAHTGEMIDELMFCAAQMYTVSADVVRSLSDCESRSWWSTHCRTLSSLSG